MSHARHSRLHPPHRPEDRIVIHSPDDIPDFVDECDQVEFWATHELGDEFWDNAPPISAEERALMDRIRANRRARTAQR